MRRSQFVLAVVLALPSRNAGAAEYRVTPGGENQVTFVSHAPTETFEGRTRHLEGRIVVDPGGVTDSITVHFEVDLASLDTGIAKRNKHMRENHLETAKYARAVFDGVAVVSPAKGKLESGKPVRFEVVGTFTLHGVSRRLPLVAEVTYLPQSSGGRLMFRTSFPVALSDYAIRRPEFLFLKLAETQEVKVLGVGIASP